MDSISENIDLLPQNLGFLFGFYLLILNYVLYLENTYYLKMTS